MEETEKEMKTMYLVRERGMSAEMATALKDPDKVLEKIKNLVINSQETYDAAAAERIAINKHKTLLERIWKYESAPISAAYDKLRALFVTKEDTGAQDYMEEALKLLGEKLIAYKKWCDAEDARKQREANELAEKAEQKRKDELAAQEKRWIEKGMNYAQVSAEYRKQADTETDEKEKARLNGLADIAQLKADKADEKAIEKQQAAQAVFIPPQVLRSSFQQAAGTSMQDHWTAKIDGNDEDVALKLLFDAVVSGKADLSYLTFNWPALNRVAPTKRNISKVPGIIFVNNPISKSARK